MTIEGITEIDLAMRLRLAVARLQRLLRQQATGGLTLTQLSCLSTVTRVGPIPLTALAVRENLSAPSITKITSKLEEAGLVLREGAPGDRRVNLLSATVRGKALVDEVRNRRTAFLDTRLSELTIEQREALAAAVPVLELLAGEAG